MSSESFKYLVTEHQTYTCPCFKMHAVAVILGIIVLALSITLGIRSKSSTEPGSSDVCLTPGCIQLSAQIAAAINQSADPCQDFYQFSCGGWVKDNIIPVGTCMALCVVDIITSSGVYRLNAGVAKL